MKRKKEKKKVKRTKEKKRKEKRRYERKKYEKKKKENKRKGKKRKEKKRKRTARQTNYLPVSFSLNSLFLHLYLSPYLQFMGAIQFLPACRMFLGMCPEGAEEIGRAHV